MLDEAVPDEVKSGEYIPARRASRGRARGGRGYGRRPSKEADEADEAGPADPATRRRGRAATRRRGRGRSACGC